LVVSSFEWFGEVGLFVRAAIPYRDRDEIGSKSLPLMALAGATTGIVLSLQTRTSLLQFAARQFRTVEIDSTFYGTPSAKTVESVRRWQTGECLQR